MGKAREILDFEEALRRVVAAAPEMQAETVALDEAQGRYLAEAIDCEADVPAADNSAMDGFGVKAADLRPGARLRLVGDSLAGVPLDQEIEAGTCARVMTGGLIPAGVDSVVPVELTSGYEPAADGSIEFREVVAEGANIRRRGSVKASGDRLVSSGTRISPAVLGVLAQQGRAELRVAKAPRVAVLPTGDEVVEVDESPAPGQVRNSNAYALVAQARACGAEVERLPILRDREGDTLERLRGAFSRFDLVCTIGGVSMGTKDLVRAAFAELGGEVIVESTKIKPGKPTLFGSVSGGASHLLGLPGNPASSFTIFELLGVPFLRAMQGVPPQHALVRHRARMGSSSLRKNWRLQVMPGRARFEAQGVVVEELAQRSSADLFSLAEANALWFAPADTAPGEGDEVEWIPSE